MWYFWRCFTDVSPHALVRTSREAQSFWHLVNWHICYMLLQRTMIGVYRERETGPWKRRKTKLQSSWLCTMTRVGTERERESASDCLKWCHKSQPERKHWWPLLSSCPLPLTPPPCSCKALGAPGSFQVYFILHIHGLQKQAPHPRLAHKSSSCRALKATKGREESMWALQAVQQTLRSYR